MNRAATPVQGLVFKGPGADPVVEELWLDPPAAGEVQVRLVAAGVCHSDLHVVDGDWARPRDVVLGHEGAAIVEALGPGEPAGRGALRVGDLVVLAWTAPCGAGAACARDESWLCLSPHGAGHRMSPQLVRLRRGHGSPVGVYSGIGTFCTRQVVAAEAAIAVDPRTPGPVAALIGCAAATGVGAVRNTAQVAAGESVVVIGLGGVGLAALLAAVRAGATPVIAVDLEPSKRELALAMGATDAVTIDGAAALARTLPGGGADHVLECIGLTATAEAAIDLARPGGTITLVGMTRQGDRAGIDVYRFVEEGKRLLGSNYGSATPSRDFPGLARDAVEGRLDLGRLVTETIALEDVAWALDAMRRRDGGRRVVLFDGGQ